MTYGERAAQLEADASVAVMVLSDPDCTDIELFMLKPRQVPEAELAHLASVGHSRNLNPIGVIGLVGSTPKCALREPLEPGKVSRLVDAFLAYLRALFSDGFGAA
jgi:hypothetical protein